MSERQKRDKKIKERERGVKKGTDPVLLSPRRADWLLVYLMYRHLALTVRSCFSHKGELD